MCDVAEQTVESDTAQRPAKIKTPYRTPYRQLTEAFGRLEKFLGRAEANDPSNELREAFTLVREFVDDAKKREVRQAKGAKHLLMTLDEYFEHAPKSLMTPREKSLDMIRAMASCTLVFPNVPATEELLRAEEIIQSFQRDSGVGNRLRLADLHGISWKEVTRIGRRCIDRVGRAAADGTLSRESK